MSGGRGVAGSRPPVIQADAQTQADSETLAGRGPAPWSVQVLAVIELVEAAGVLVAATLAGFDTGSGHSYHLASGIAITAIGIGTAFLLAVVARGLRAGRRWSRTPALLTQLFTGIVGIYLAQGARYEWGIPALVLAVSGFAMLMAPPSLELLTPGRVRKPGRS